MTTRVARARAVSPRLGPRFGPRFGLSLVLWLVVSLLTGVPGAAAQPVGAAISGLVTDTSGAVLPGAWLTLADATRGVQRQATANERGEYTFGGLPPGRYVLSAGHDGFAPLQVADITLTDGERRTLPVRLTVAPLTEQVSIAAPRGYTSRITMGKTEQSLREIPQSISVITRQRLDDQILLSLDQALAQSPGMTVAFHPTNPTISSRGFTLSSVQRDGVPIEMGGNFLAQPDLAIYERVEVLRGAAGLFSGAGAPGGAVNLVRKRALARPQAQAAIIGGTWGTYRVDADATGALNRSHSLRGRVVAAYQNRGYFFNADDSSNSVIYGRLDYDLTPRTVLSGGGVYEMRDGLPYTNGLPFYADGTDIRLDRSTYLAAAWTRWDFRKPELFAEVDHRFSSTWKARIAWNQVREHSDYKAASGFGALDPVTQRGTVVDGIGIEQRDGMQNGLDATLNGGFSAFGRRHEIVAGVNYLRRDETVRNVYPTYGPYAIDVFTFDPHSLPEPATPAWTAETDVDIAQLGTYGVLRLHLTSRLSLAAGARISNWRQRRWNVFTGASTQDYDVRGEVTPYGAVTFDLGRAWSLYGSYADVFQPQNSFTHQGTLLPPIVGANYEGGIKGDWWNGALNASAAVFRIDQTNRAQVDPEHPAPCAGSPTGTCSIATGEVLSTGFEAEVVGRLLPDLDLSSGYTYNTTEYVRDRTAAGVPSANEGRPFQTFVPRHMVRLWAGYRLPLLERRVSVGTGITAQSSQYAISNAIQVRQGAYGLWNARVSLRLDANWTLALNATNLLDTTYYRSLANVNYVNHYGDPRSVMVTLRLH